VAKKTATKDANKKDANKFVGDVYVSSSPKPKKLKKGGK